MEYEIKGGTLPVVICNLESGEKVITEGGAMTWMSPNMKMETTAGGAKKAFGRLFSGENMFQNIYTAEGTKGMIAFASSFPGSLKAFEISSTNEMILQKRAFLASSYGVEMSVFFNKKLGSGLFGGEGFIMQKISGNGIVFAEFDGYVIEYDLKEGQQIVVDTSHLAAMESTCSMDIRQIKGAKNIFLGGEGLFNTIVTGPGHIWLQSMTIENLAGLIRPFMPTGNN